MTKYFCEGNKVYLREVQLSDVSLIVEWKNDALILSRLNQSKILFESLKQTWESATLLALEDTIPQAQNVGKILKVMLKPLIDAFPQKKQVVEDSIKGVSKRGKLFAKWLVKEIKPRTEVSCRSLGKENYQKLLEIRREGHSWSERLRIGEKSLKEAFLPLQQRRNIVEAQTRI